MTNEAGLRELTQLVVMVAQALAAVGVGGWLQHGAIGVEAGLGAVGAGGGGEVLSGLAANDSGERPSAEGLAHEEVTVGEGGEIPDVGESEDLAVVEVGRAVVPLVAQDVGGGQGGEALGGDSGVALSVGYVVE